jgi:hypothetical protein
MTTSRDVDDNHMSDPATPSQGLLPALVMLAGTVLSLSGLAWDVGWHSDVGPDSFFTLPHLFVYSGGAIAGLTSLVMVLRATAAQRRGQAPDPTTGGRAFRVLGVFSAPIGYLIGGVAAASFLLYGLWDEWWHGLYGFDVTIASPPHQGWLNSICITIVGTAIVFAAAREHRWGRYGYMMSLAVFGSYFSVTSLGLSEINTGLSIDWVQVAGVVIPIACVLMGGRVLPRGGALGTGVVYLVLNVAVWSFAVWAVGWYADVEHLALRDFSHLGFPTEHVIIPAAVLVFSIVVELLLRLREATAWALGLYGGVGAFAVTWWLSQTGDGHQGPESGLDTSSTVFTSVASGALGVIVGLAIWRLGYAMRLARTAHTVRTDVGASA